MKCGNIFIGMKNISIKMKYKIAINTGFFFQVHKVFPRVKVYVLKNKNCTWDFEIKVFFEDLMDAMLCNHSSKIREIYLMKKPSKLAIFFEL